MKFTILGAGLSGLCCATALKRQGHDVCVVEKESEVGGLARSFRANGYTFDYGPHFLFGQKAHDLIQVEFPNVDLRRVSSTKEKMFFREKYFNFPFDPKNILVNMDRRKVPGALWELTLKRLFIGPASRTTEAQSVEDWVVEAVGRRMYDYISLAGYIRKLYGLDPKVISNEWGMQKLQFLSKWRDASLVKLAVRSFSEQSNVAKRVIHYPRGGGIEHLPLGISETFVSSGGRLLLGSEATEVRHRDDGVCVTVRTGRELGQVEGDFLISTLPITALITMLKPAVSSRIIGKGKLLRHRTLLVLCLCLRRDTVLKDQCVYFTEDQFFFRRITEFKHLDSGMTPAGKTSICVEITCFENDGIYRMSRNDLSELVISQLVLSGYVCRSDIEEMHFVRVPFAYPVYEMASTNALDEVLGCLESYDRLLSIGRQGLFHYNAMNSSILTATELGKRLAETGLNNMRGLVRETYQIRREKYRRD